MRLRCEKCNTYYSVKHSRGTQLKSLRCPKDSGLLVYMTFSDINGELKDKYGFKWTYEGTHLVPGQTVFVPVAGGVVLNTNTSTER